ncbi:MAG: hypothetical protein ACI4A3_02035 [Lachnospiraceae bacterium]
MNLDVNEDRDGDKKSTHDQYTEAYVGILNTYKQQLYQSVMNKNQLKQSFFSSIKKIMYILVITYGIVVILSLIIMAIMAMFDSSSTQILVGAIVSIASSFVTMILGIYKLPQIIADYLFNKEEDQLMKEIIENIQRYELDADMAEKMRNRASVDAAMNTMLTMPDIDSEMDNSPYVDSSMISSITDISSNEDITSSQDVS